MKRRLLTILLLVTVLGNISKAQTIDAPVMLCVTTDQGSGDVTINWQNPTLDPCGPFVGYVLYGARTPTGPFLIIDTIDVVTQETYFHFGANGTILEWYYFMVTIQDCPGATIDTSAVIQEQILFQPEMDFVTVTANGIEVHWINPSPQAVAFEISFNNPGTGLTVIDTVFGSSSTTYLDNSQGNPDQASQGYTLKSIDDCGNRSNAPGEHRTIFMEFTSDRCAGDLTLDWTPYQGWGNDVQEYRVIVETDVTPAFTENTFAGNLPAYQYDLPLDNINGNTICVTIQGIRASDGQVTNSNQICTPINLVQSTTFNYMRRVTVDQSDALSIEWYVDSAADINAYEILRGTQSTSLDVIQNIPVSTPVILNAFTDSSVSGSQNSYYFQVSSIDDCGFELESGKGRSIKLSGTNSGGLNALTWNEYELDFGTVLSYTINRVENNVPVPVTTVGPTQLTYDDEIADAINETGSFCYVITAEYLLDIPGFISETLTTNSNEFCVDIPPKPWVPNAFVPEGENKMFKPVFRNPNLADYEFVIFDRWGKVLFETNLINAGWDGSNKGEKMPTGGYAYYIKATSLAGTTTEETGVVVLVR